jgi:hypothetical protein
VVSKQKGSVKVKTDRFQSETKGRTKPDKENKGKPNLRDPPQKPERFQDSLTLDHHQLRLNIFTVQLMFIQCQGNACLLQSVRRYDFLTNSNNPDTAELLSLGMSTTVTSLLRRGHQKN